MRDGDEERVNTDLIHQNSIVQYGKHCTLADTCLSDTELPVWHPDFQPQGLVAAQSETADAQVFEGPVDHGLKFAGIFNFPPLGQDDPRLLGIEPRRITKSLLGTAGLLHFHEEGLDDVFQHASALPEHTFGVHVNVEVPRLDDSGGAGFFQGFTFRGLTVRQAGIGRAFGKRPLPAAVGVDQQKFRVRITTTVADGRYLKR